MVINYFKYKLENFKKYFLSGTHVHTADCNPEGRINEYKQKQNTGKLFPTSLEVRNKKVAKTTKPNGGWGDPRDHVLCETVTSL